MRTKFELVATGYGIPLTRRNMRLNGIECFAHDVTA